MGGRSWKASGHREWDGTRAEQQKQRGNRRGCSRRVSRTSWNVTVPTNNSKKRPRFQLRIPRNVAVSSVNGLRVPQWMGHLYKCFCVCGPHCHSEVNRPEPSRLPSVRPPGREPHRFRRRHYRTMTLKYFTASSQLSANCKMLQERCVNHSLRVINAESALDMTLCKEHRNLCSASR